MDCYRCWEEKGELVKMYHQNGDQHSIFLCEDCISYFDADEAVKYIELRKPM